MSLAAETAIVGENFRKAAPPHIVELIVKASKDF